MEAVLPSPAADSWVENSNIGNFNPETKPGHEIFEKKTKVLKEYNRLTATKNHDQSICCFLENKAPSLGKVLTQILITYDAVGDPTEWGNLRCKYGSICMNILKRKAHKSFSNLVTTVDPLPASPFTAMTLDAANVDLNKKIFYSRVDSKVVAELIKNILTDSEYSNLMLKENMFTFQDDTTGNKIIDGLCLLKLLYDRIEPNVVEGVEVLRKKLKAMKLHPYQNNVDAMLTDMKNLTERLSTIISPANRSVDTC